MVHIHDMVSDTDGTLLVATHTGLYRIEDPTRAVLVGPEQHDLMSMTRNSAGLVASGHPDLRLDTYRVADHPPLLGLVQTGDNGQTWEQSGLLGEADFHALVDHPDGLYGAESQGTIWRFTNDGGWERLGSIEARDLAVDPTDSASQLATTHKGQLQISSDGARTWSAIINTPPLIEVEWPEDNSILGIDAEGTIWATAGHDSNWEPVASGPANTETFYVDETRTWFAATESGQISESNDGGITWTTTYSPPAED